MQGIQGQFYCFLGGRWAVAQYCFGFVAGQDGVAGEFLCGKSGDERFAAHQFGAQLLNAAYQVHDGVRDAGKLELSARKRFHVVEKLLVAEVFAAEDIALAVFAMFHCLHHTCHHVLHEGVVAHGLAVAGNDAPGAIQHPFEDARDAVAVALDAGSEDSRQVNENDLQPIAQVFPTDFHLLVFRALIRVGERIAVAGSLIEWLAVFR